MIRLIAQCGLANPPEALVSWLFFGGMTILDQKMISILRCPKCKGELEHKNSDNESENNKDKPENEHESFICTTCRLVFEVNDGIPNFLIDEAQPLA